MSSFLESMTAPLSLTPRGFCLSWDPWLFWTHVGSDGLTGLSYLAISAMLAMVVLRRGRRTRFRSVYWLFAAFITLCGVGHLLHISTIWTDLSWIEGASKLLTAGVSAATGLYLWRQLPKAANLPSVEELEAANTELLRKQRENREVELELRDQQARYRAAFKLAPSALHTLDGDMRILAVSERWCQLFGYARDEVIGRDIRELCDQEATPRQRVTADLQVLLKTNDLMEFERRFRRKDGTWFDAVVSTRAEWLNCEEVRLHSSVQDVTDRKQAEAKLLAVQENLAHARRMEAIGQLTGGVAHDFNNMLQAILGNLKLTMDVLNAGGEAGPDGRAKMRRRVGNALTATEQAGRTAAQLLAVARRSQLEPRPIDPVETVRCLEVLFRTFAAAAGGITFRWEVAADVGSCLADPGQLKAAVLNMVKNACDAIGERRGGGTITFVISRMALRAEADPDAPAAGDYVRIAVVDDGPGMSPEVRARALEPFFTTKPQGQGTGLGLSQTFGFARQSGGTVQIDTAEGAGCSVALLLPRIAGVTEASNEGTADALPHGLGECVLVAEDDDMVRETLVEQLQDLGYKVIETVSADQALSALDTPGLRIDAVVSDNAMPGSMTGVELLTLVRQRFPTIPALLVSGRMDRPVSEVTGIGARFMAKPYERDDLARVLREMLAARRQLVS